MRFFKSVMRRFRSFILERCSESITSEERCLMIIIKKLLTDEESELYMLPDLSKFYVKSEKNGLFVIIDFTEKNASVINHKFGYSISVSQRVLKYVNGNFSNELEKRRIAMEEEYKKNVQNSLYKVIENL